MTQWVKVLAEKLKNQVNVWIPYGRKKEQWHTEMYTHKHK